MMKRLHTDLRVGLLACIGLLIFSGSTTTVAQTITISANTSGAAASPLAAGTTDVVIFGIELDKANDPTTTTVTQLVVDFGSEDPSTRFSNARLYRSNDATFDGVGTEALADNGTFGATTITFAASPLTNFGNNTAQTDRHFFLVVDVNASVDGSTPSIQAEVTGSDITTGGTIAGGPVTGGTYTFAGATVTINQITGGVAPDPLGSASTNLALLGFSLTSNSNPDFTAITINTSSAASGKISNIRLFSSANNTYGGGDVSIATASSVTGSTIEFTGLSEGLSGSASYFFVVANVDASVNASTPQLELSFDESDVTVSTGTVQAATVTGTDYSFEDIAPPTISARTPADGANGVSISLNTLQITFNEDVVYVGDNTDADNMIRIRDLDANAFIDTIEVANVSVAANVVTITFLTPLSQNTDYAIRIGNSVFEDNEGNAFTGITNDTNWDFETEAGPNITSYSADPTCVGETITINGAGFGIATPTVTVNGQAATVNSHTLTTISIVVPNTTSGVVIVTNNNNGLSGNDNTLTLKPAIAASLPIASNPTTPAIGQNYDIQVANTQNNVNYAIRELPGGFGGTTAGTGGTISFGSYNKGTDGTYQYEIRATSTGCTQQTYGPYSVIIAALAANAGSNKTICNGDSVILGGNPTASGGTAYYSITWNTVPPTSNFSTASNPLVKPTSTTTYRVSVKDSPSGAPETDDITITVNPTTSLSFVDTLRTAFSTNDTLYLLSDKVIITPSGGSGDFSGQGIVRIPNSPGGNYYFNPKAFSLPTSGIPIIYTHTAANGCISTIQTTFSVYSVNVLLTNLDNLVCSNEGMITGIFVNPSFYTPPPGKKVGVIKVYHPAYGYSLPTSPNYPLEQTSVHPTNGPVYRYNPQKALAFLNYNGYQYNYLYMDVFLADAATGLIIDPYYSTYQFVQVFEPGPQPDILPFTDGQPVCETGAVTNLYSSLDRAGYSTINYDDNSGISALITLVSGDYQFDPSEITFPGVTTTRNVTITHVYTDRTGCRDTTSRNIVMVKQIGPPTGTDAEYCEGTPDKELTLTAKVNNGATDVLWYDDGALTTFVGKGETFLTGESGATSHQKSFFATQLFNGCESNSTEVVIEIKKAPDADFTPPSICVNRPFTLVGPTENDPDYDIDSYEWTFGDGDSISYGQTVDYMYTAINQYKIGLRVTSTENCEALETRNIIVGLNPKPTFDFNNICDGDATNFAGDTDIPVQQYQWDFGDGTIIGPGNSNNAAPGGGTFKSPQHTFTDGVGEYRVVVRATTITGCFDTLARTLNILPVLTYTSSNPYIMVNEDGGKGFWIGENLRGDSITWEFGTKQDTILNFTESAWVTNAEENYFPNTFAVLNSPCLNIAAIARPVVSFNFLSNIDEGDGAALQYSTNGGVTWSNVGNMNSGKNWFNDLGIPFGGGNNQGWSGNLWEGDTTWTEARRILDDITPRTKIRFRMAFLTGQEGEAEGFAFRNFSIESRNRMMLVENFTNDAAPSATTNNTDFYGLPTTERVKLEYHTSFPAADELNEQNPADQNARTAFYGISNGSGLIPRVYIDGSSEGNLLDNNWFTRNSLFRALESSPLEISITTLPIDLANPGNFNIQTAVKANRPLIGNPKVHTVIVEKSVGDNQFVVRKFLPNATGTLLPANILSLPDSTYTLTQNWQVANVSVIAEMAVVVFVQDEVTKEVHQAQYLENPGNLPAEDDITATEETFESQIKIYPNPAAGAFHIQLPAKSNKALPFVLIDGFGREVHTNTFKTGEQSKVITTLDFAAGVYVLQIKSEKGELARKKIIIVN